MQRERAYHEQVKTLPTSGVEIRDDVVPFSQGSFFITFFMRGDHRNNVKFYGIFLSDLQYVVHCLGC